VFDGRVISEMGRALSILGLILAAHGGAAETAQPKASPSPALYARCEAESSKRFGTPPVTSSLPKEGLKRLRGAKPVYPKLPPGTQGRGLAMHEALIAPDGKVVSVWPLREPAFEPPYPDFAKAIVDALLTWEYEPHLSGGMPSVGVPVCMVVTTHIHWR
jgi:hypothetical protein